MKLILKFSNLLLVVLFLCNISCREEEFVFEGARPEESLSLDTNIANLLLRTTTKDGSFDNIVDGASCISIQFPYTVSINGDEVVVDEVGDFETIENLLENDDGDDTAEKVLEINFPVTIVLSDFTKVIVNTPDELSSFIATCSMVDEDIECVDFIYPISFSVFNRDSEVFDIVSKTDDEMLYVFLADLNERDVVTIEFPVTLLLSDATQIEVTDIIMLEETIESVKDNCDEDDNNDFDDDDCEECSLDLLSQTWLLCTAWEAHKLEIDDEKLDDAYEDFLFNFQEDGTVLAISTTNMYIGTWISSDTDTSITLELNIPGFIEFNSVWNLEEIKETGRGTDVRLNTGDDKLHFRETCEEGSTGNNIGLDSNIILTDGTWEVNTFLDADVDKTTDFNGYSFNFDTDGTVIADNGTIFNGTWLIQTGNTRLLLDFGTGAPLELLNVNWKIDAVSESRVEVREVGEGNATDTLILTKR
ncbi:hypothetical protein [Maribacter sp. 2210JD10-5]|uniref:hypothetical protein n=1 Tax=Maribacter sp. 2210JD10-5 TaxID=3386272 RepID=UPI0039BCF58F